MRPTQACADAVALAVIETSEILRAASAGSGRGAGANLVGQREKLQQAQRDRVLVDNGRRYRIARERLVRGWIVNDIVGEREIAGALRKRRHTADQCAQIVRA